MQALDALCKSLANELRLQIARAMGVYDGLYGLGFMPNAPITARMVESKSRMPAPIIFSANAGKIGLLGDAMDVLIVYTLLDDARDGVARVMNVKTPDDINPAVVMGAAQPFLANRRPVARSQRQGLDTKNQRRARNPESRLRSPRGLTA